MNGLSVLKSCEVQRSFDLRCDSQTTARKCISASQNDNLHGHAPGRGALSAMLE